MLNTIEREGVIKWLLKSLFFFDKYITAIYYNLEKIFNFVNDNVREQLIWCVEWQEIRKWTDLEKERKSDQKWPKDAKKHSQYMHISSRIVCVCFSE